VLGQHNKEELVLGENRHRCWNIWWLIISRTWQVLAIIDEKTRRPVCKLLCGFWQVGEVIQLTEQPLFLVYDKRAPHWCCRGWSTNQTHYQGHFILLFRKKTNQGKRRAGIEIEFIFVYTRSLWKYLHWHNRYYLIAISFDKECLTWLSWGICFCNIKDAKSAWKFNFSVLFCFVIVSWCLVIPAIEYAVL